MKTPKAAALKSAGNTAAQSVPGYGLVAAVISMIDGTTWWHALVIPALPLLDALITYLHRMKVPHIDTVASYVQAVETASYQTPGDGPDSSRDVDRAEGA